MPGMGGSLQTNNSTIVSAFQSSLLHQSLVVLVLLAVLAVAWNLLRASQLARAATGDPAPQAAPEPPARRFVRIAFGFLWVIDGVLQAQSSMPIGLPGEVVKPAAAGSPAWVGHLVNSGVTIWSNHPIEAAVATVWIQIGIGAWLLVAPRGRISRLGGTASIAWALVVWIFGEAFGGIFAPGLTWLFGAPGSVLFYAVAGALVALPERAFASARLGRIVLGGMGLFFAGMALLQAWPGRGFWEGRHDGRLGPLAAMVHEMAQTSQPAFLASWLSGFASFAGAHGFAVNLFVVVALAALGVAFVSRRPRVVRPALVAAIVLCLADWLLVEDLGFLGGVGTDPNSMVPIALLLGAGYLALVHVPAVVEEPAPLVPFLPVRRRLGGADAAGELVGAVTAGEAPSAPGWRDRVRHNPTYVFRAAAAGVAVVVTLLGAAPMAIASTNPHADAIVSEAIDGTPNETDVPAPPFSLVAQDGSPVSLSSLRGKVVVLTFLDPVCTSDCPLIAQELRQVDSLVGRDKSEVELVAVVANPIYRARSFTLAFDAQEGLDRVANWRFLTGSLQQLEATWSDYGVEVATESAGAMVAHSDLVYVIDPSGNTREVFQADPGPGTTVTQSSFASLVAGEVERLVPSS